ncbi:MULTISPECIES: hypothetical protein [Nostoc]|uniref:Uncharacterized protein n=1 Tax=Nostoc paludosum FACHB-159 TaxID=2692908 RepID=A0ABR8KMH2_9NOSO|nr:MULTISPECIES: hypothetical protein [Nostoc]MBD2683585.1 hypothetical protein [Nostoc sp. FACHB-857]MBD2739904.1 hypothetical protein [Nostoc paludosum FACHB-159]
MQIQPPPQKFLLTLLSIKDYYAPLVEKYGKLYTEALENLTHVEALLSNWALKEEADTNGSSGEATEEILTLPAQKSLDSNSGEDSKTEPELGEANETDVPQVSDLVTENVSSQSQEDINLPLEENQPASGVVESLSNGESFEIPQTQIQSDESFYAAQESKTFDNSDNSDNSVETTSELVQPSTISSSLLEDEPAAAESTSLEQASSAPNKSLLGQDIPMVGEYHSLRRIEAVEKLLHQHIGSVCHIDLIVRSLYGELEPKTTKVVKGRVHSTLTQGKESGKWSLVPGKPGYYTKDLKLLNSSRKNSSSKPSPTQSKKPDPHAKANSIPMKAEFDGKFLIDAISSLMQKNPTTVFDVPEVINQLYGKLKPEQVQQVRPSVLNELSRGYRTGRFSRVPEEKGLYIWDSKLLPD